MIATKRRPKPKVEELHFVVTGEFLTNHCRSLWADEDRQDLAISTLKTAFPEMTQPQILAVLTGSKKMIGDSTSGCELVDDDAEVSPHGNSLSLVPQLDREHEQTVKLKRSVQMAAGRVGYIPSPAGMLEIPEELADKVADGDLDFNSPEIEEYWKPFMSEKSEERPKPAPVSASSNGWIDRGGKYYPCGYLGHTTLADDLGSEEKDLEERGWIKVSDWLSAPIAVPPREEISEPQRRATKAQLRTILDWCSQWKRSHPKWIK